MLYMEQWSSYRYFGEHGIKRSWGKYESDSLKDRRAGDEWGQRKFCEQSSHMLPSVDHVD